MYARWISFVNVFKMSRLPRDDALRGLSKKHEILKLLARETDDMNFDVYEQWDFTNKDQHMLIKS